MGELLGELACGIISTLCEVLLEGVCEITGDFLSGVLDVNSRDKSQHK